MRFWYTRTFHGERWADFIIMMDLSEFDGNDEIGIDVVIFLLVKFIVLLG